MYVYDYLKDLLLNYYILEGISDELFCIGLERKCWVG